MIPGTNYRLIADATSHGKEKKVYGAKPARL